MATSEELQQSPIKAWWLEKGVGVPRKRKIAKVRRKGRTVDISYQVYLFNQRKKAERKLLKQEKK